jgi:hypothetical protein
VSVTYPPELLPAPNEDDVVEIWVDGKLYATKEPPMAMSYLKLPDWLPEDDFWEIVRLIQHFEGSGEPETATELAILICEKLRPKVT